MFSVANALDSNATTAAELFQSVISAFLAHNLAEVKLNNTQSDIVYNPQNGSYLSGANRQVLLTKYYDTKSTTGFYF